ncbi:MAG: hypothetical protein Q4D04_15445, partial [Clostridia bacterium]|nr:hypothetical protein [Clostridia bacterium]
MMHETIPDRIPDTKMYNLNSAAMTSASRFYPDENDARNANSFCGEQCGVLPRGKEAVRYMHCGELILSATMATIPCNTEKPRSIHVEASAETTMPRFADQYEPPED